MTVSRLQEEIAEGEVDIDSLREDMEMIAESADQITEVKEQLIGAVREQAPRPVLLSDVVRTAALQRGLKLSMLATDVDAAVVYTIADSTQLTRALGNVLQNASEAGAKKIDISAALAEEAGMLKLTIADDGAGMSEDMLSKVWTPFFTAKGTAHQGLGLPAALHVISQAQGHMDISSEEGTLLSCRPTLCDGGGHRYWDGQFEFCDFGSGLPEQREDIRVLRPQYLSPHTSGNCPSSGTLVCRGRRTGSTD